MSLHLSSPPKRLCLLRLSAIGDVSHVLPTLRLLQQHWPETHLSWVIGTTEYQLVREIEGVEFILLDKKSGLRGLLALWRQLRGRHFDLLFNMQVSPRAALASLAIRAPIRIGYDRARDKWLHRLVCNQRIAARPQQHVLDSFLEFPRRCGLQVDNIRWDLPLTREAQQQVGTWLPQGQEFMVVNPCSSIRANNYRNWSPKRYAAIIDQAYKQFGLQTFLTGGPAAEEQALARAIIECCQHQPSNLVGATSLQQLLVLLQRAQVVIAPDTGPAHLANAIGTPVIGLYASSNPQRSGPYSCLDLCVNRYPDAVAAEFGCDPSQLRWGKRVRNPAVMELIRVDDVLECLKRALHPANPVDQG